ncbi:hypothetical protein [Actinoplanes sp. NPDC051851]|uniref:hypothetical protein n=1 Tax=Actinoplanes sp. NPDC051851 TaxID=3154753 RepID=UPI00341FCDD6
MLLAPMLAAAVAAGTVCTVDDQRVDEASGLVATDGGYVVVNDGTDLASHRKIFYLDGDCDVKRTVSYPSQPRDTEDMQLGADGTLWIADIGDNNANRETIGLWKLAPGASKPTLYRLSYPDGARDAEALLVTADGTPMIITKTAAAAGIYVPDGVLKKGSTTPMKSVGDVAVPITTTSNPWGLAGHLVVTGAATSPDGSRVVLRTYADAFEYDVTDGDVLTAITEGTPRRIAMPDEPQGESVTYTPDGTALLTISEGEKPKILRYALPDAPSPSPSAETTTPAASHQATTNVATAAEQSRLPLLLFLVGGLGIVLSAAGIMILRRRG